MSYGLGRRFHSNLRQHFPFMKLDDGLQVRLPAMDIHDRRTAFKQLALRIAETRPGIVNSLAAICTGSPKARSVADVTGPMEAA